MVGNVVPQSVLQGGGLKDEIRPHKGNPLAVKSALTASKLLLPDTSPTYSLPTMPSRGVMIHSFDQIGRRPTPAQGVESARNSARVVGRRGISVGE